MTNSNNNIKNLCNYFQTPYKCPQLTEINKQLEAQQKRISELTQGDPSWYDASPADAFRMLEEKQQHINNLEATLRTLASWLGNGGYNATEVDPVQFEAKIREGIIYLINKEKSEKEKIKFEMQKQIDMLKLIINGLEDIVNNKVLSFDEVKEKLERKYKGIE